MELKLKLGIEHSPSTVRRYMVESGRPSRSTWRRFLRTHAHEIFTMDFTTHFLWDYSVRHVLVIMALDTRRIVHIAVTASPTLGWVKQQIREATPWGTSPRFLIHDNDGILGQFARGGQGAHRRDGPERRYRCALDGWLDTVLGVDGIPIPYGAPNAAAHIERFMGTLKRECLRHFIFFSEDHLRRTTFEFIGYFNEARPHEGIAGIPLYGAGEPRASPPPEPDVPLRLVARPVLGGLAHDYRLAA